MAMSIVCRWIAAAMTLGLMIGVSAAAGQEGAGGPSSRAATAASTSPAALPEAMVPPVRRVRPADIIQAAVFGVGLLRRE